MSERIFLSREQLEVAKMLVEAHKRTQAEAAYQIFMASLSKDQLDKLIGSALAEKNLDANSSVKFDVTTGEIIVNERKPE